jgi:GTP cyclohydrolase II
VSKVDPLIEVDRVISELRRGASVRIHLGEVSVLMLAAEAVSTESLSALAFEAASPPALVMTGTRANVLELDKSDHHACLVTARTLA